MPCYLFIWACQAHYVGYPEAALEPLQAVRYAPGQFYKPHHDYYNACETWQEGNRHFTFLVYLNAVNGGGHTGFPALNLTLEATPYAALLFNDCLDNGEPNIRRPRATKLLTPRPPTRLTLS
jgi:prolyl 4-hydroxylase